jgi:hypothetical protein
VGCNGSTVRAQAGTWDSLGTVWQEIQIGVRFFLGFLPIRSARPWTPSQLRGGERGEKRKRGCVPGFDDGCSSARRLLLPSGSSPSLSLSLLPLRVAGARVIEGGWVFRATRGVGFAKLTSSFGCVLILPSKRSLPNCAFRRLRQLSPSSSSLPPEKGAAAGAGLVAVGIGPTWFRERRRGRGMLPEKGESGHGVARVFVFRATHQVAGISSFERNLFHKGRTPNGSVEYQPSAA